MISKYGVNYMIHPQCNRRTDDSVKAADCFIKLLVGGASDHRHQIRRCGIQRRARLFNTRFLVANGSQPLSSVLALERCDW